MKDMEKAILERDFHTFATLTMQDSNQFHAICLDTLPPICYLNDTSRNIIQLVTDYNRNIGEIRCAYTFDAGPNAVLYVQQQHLLEVSAVVARAFGLRLFLPLREEKSPVSVLLTDIESCHNAALEKVTFLGGVERVYVTKVGPGPQIVADACNLDVQTGLNVYRVTGS
jgi:diphosphomevalonate decarboxylase